MHYLVLLAAASAACAQTLVIRNITAVDAGGSHGRWSVVIDGGKIIEAGPGVKVPSDARVINGSGKFLIPGLWDMHVHLWESDPMLGLYVASGVLGVRDMGSDLPRTRSLREAIASRRRIGPQIYTGGPPVDGPASEMKQTAVIKVATPEDGRRATDTVDESLADFVKVLSTVPEDAYLALAQRARVRRIPFAGHLPESVPLAEAIDARQRSVEHLFGVGMACSPDETRLRRERAAAIASKDYPALRRIREQTYATFSSGMCSELARRMARLGVWQTPTLTLRKRLALLDLDRLASVPELRWVPQPVRKQWTDPRTEAARATDEQRADFREDWEFHRKLVKSLASSGAPILAGTDTGDPWVVPGFSLHDELELLVEAGLSPADALATATLQPARYFDLEATQGTIARGKMANLVLLDANPLEDIRNTRRISTVILSGSVLDRPCLDGLLAGSESRCSFESSSPKPVPSSVKRRASSRRRGSRTR